MTKTHLKIDAESDETNSQAMARVISSPELAAAVTHQMLNGIGSLSRHAPEMTDLMKHMQQLGQSGETGEAALLAQAATLDKLFNHMIQLAFSAKENKPTEHFELWLKFAFRAQSQCRTTYQAVSDIRHPRVQFVKEQYNSNGPQQVNNGGQVDNGTGSNSAHETKKQNSQNELTEGLPDDIHTNSGTQTGVSGEKPDPQAVAEINRTNKRGRKNKVIA